MRIRDLIKRDIGQKVEGIVKVFDRASLSTEFREYVLTDRIEKDVKDIIDCFTQQSEMLRRGGTPRDVMGIWISGFFGSGKSHFAKVLGYLLQNETLGDDSPERCIDAFIKHLSDTPRGKSVVLRLKELEATTQIETIPFEIKSRQSLTNPNSVGEIMLSEFYRHIGLSENFIIARIERRFQSRGLLEKLEQTYESRYGIPWRHSEGRDDFTTVRHRLAEILPVIDPSNYPDQKDAKKGLDVIFRHEKITAKGIADELVAWVDSQKTTGGKVQHLVFVIDEMGTFIGDSTEKISELNAIAEMVGNKGKGKVWIIATSQQDLEKVVDRTNFQPVLVGRLNARFELKPHLISDEINKVVSERILKKHPSEEPQVRECYRTHEGHIAQLADLKASRHLGTLDEKSFVDSYPFLPHQIQLAQDIFEALSGFRLSGGVRSMISVVMEALQELADKELGAIVGFDQIFDAVENDLLSQEYLGTAGVRAITEANKRVKGVPMKPGRVLKVLWLLQKIAWVPRIPETMAKLLMQNLDTEIALYREKVEQTLNKLQEAGYVGKDETTGEWKYLNEHERTMEQAIQEMVRTGGPKSISIAAVRRSSQQMCRDEVIKKKRLNNFSVLHGKTKVPFPFGVFLDGEAIETGPDLEVFFLSPLAAGRKEDLEEIRKQNQIAGVRGQRIWWIAATPEKLEARLRRYQALLKVTGDKRFIEDSSKDMQDALSVKRKERDELKTALVRDMEAAFLSGSIFYGGQEVDLEDYTDMKESLKAAIASMIPNVYPRFVAADREFDFPKQLKALLNPSITALHSIAPNLDLFDTQGGLQRESDLVSQVLEVLADLEDEGFDPTGSVLLDAKENKGFRGFGRLPFGWPGELVRLVLAACFRAGAIYLEEPTGAGLEPRYEYRDSEDLFAKINTFKRVYVRLAETSLSVEQLKEAGKLLIALGVTGVPESGNAIAAAVWALGEKFKSRIEEAERHAEAGLPVTHTVLQGKSLLSEPVTVKDPTKAVVLFLESGEAWKTLHGELKALRSFLDANRHQEFQTSRQINELAVHHPVPAGHPAHTALNQALKDMNTVIENKEVVSRWPDYRTAYESARDAYRPAYRDAYEKVRNKTQSVLDEIREGSAYQNAPADRRDGVIDGVFGQEGTCHYADIHLDTAQALLNAAARNSLTSLTQALMAIPGYKSRVEAELRALSEPPPSPDEKVLDWSPEPLLAGRRFKTEKDVDQVLKAVAEEIKKRIREGFTVVIK